MWGSEARRWQNLLSFSCEGRDGEKTLDSRGITAQTVFGRVLEKNLRFVGAKILVRETSKGVIWTGGCVGLKVKRFELDLKLEVYNIRMGLGV